MHLKTYFSDGRGSDNISPCSGVSEETSDELLGNLIWLERSETERCLRLRRGEKERCLRLGRSEK